MRRKFILIIIAITFLSHLSYIPNGFTWLDHGDIEEKRAIVSLSSPEHIFTHRFADTEFYRPMVTIMHSLDAAIYGSWSPGYHLTNVILQTLAAVAAYFFLETLCSTSPSESFFGALIFGIHPLSFLPVGAIAYRQEILLAAGLFATISLHARARLQRGMRYSIMTILCFLFTLWAKETAIIVLPAFIIVWEWQSRALHKKQTGILLWYGSLIIGYLFLRRLAVPEWWHTTAIILPWSDAVGTRITAIGKLLFFLVVPIRPSLSDATRLVSISQLPVIISVVAISFFLMWGWRQGKKGHVFLVLLFILLLPAFNIIPLPRFSSPHYGYLATILVGMFFSLVSASWSTTYRRLSAGCLIILCGSTTILAGPMFRNDNTLFSGETKHDPQFLEGHFYLGTAAWKKGDLVTADKEFTAASRKNPQVIAYVDQTALAVNQSGILVTQGKLREAEDHLRPFAGTSPLVSYNLAVLADRREDYIYVVSLLHTDAFAFHRPEPLFLLAKAYAKTGNTKEAVRILQTLGIPPDRQ